MTDSYEYCWLHAVELTQGTPGPTTPVVVVLATRAGAEVAPTDPSLMAALDRLGRDGWRFDTPASVVGPDTWLAGVLRQALPEQDFWHHHCSTAFGRRRRA